MSYEIGDRVNVLWLDPETKWVHYWPAIILKQFTRTYKVKLEGYSDWTTHTKSSCIRPRKEDMINPNTGQIIDAEAYASVNDQTPDSSSSEYSEIHSSSPNESETITPSNHFPENNETILRQSAGSTFSNLFFSEIPEVEDLINMDLTLTPVTGSTSRVEKAAFKYDLRQKANKGYILSEITDDSEGSENSIANEERQITEDTDSDSSQDDEPLTDLIPREESRQIWNTKDPDFSDSDSSHVITLETLVKSPMVYFRPYISKNWLGYICRETNQYSTEKNPNTTFSLDIRKLENFMGCSVYMSLFGITNIRNF